jgi:hypothetical protein
MEYWCGTWEVRYERARGCNRQWVKKVQEDAPDTVQSDVFVNEWKRARNREYNRAYRERKKMKILAGENIHVDPNVVERRRACGRERVKRYRERKKVKQSDVKGNVAFVDSSMHVFSCIPMYALFHHSNLRKNENYEKCSYLANMNECVWFL